MPGIAQSGEKEPLDLTEVRHLHINIASNGFILNMNDSKYASKDTVYVSKEELLKKLSEVL